MQLLVVAKKNISKGKATIKSLTNLLDKKNVNYQVVGFDDVDEFYNEIHDKKFKNTFDILLSFLET